MFGFLAAPFLSQLATAFTIGKTAFDVTNTVMQQKQQKKEAGRARDEAAQQVAAQERTQMALNRKQKRTPTMMPSGGANSGSNITGGIDYNTLALGKMALLGQ